MTFTAADAIAGRRIPIGDSRPIGLSIPARLHRLKEHGWSRATAKMLVKRIFVEGITDSAGYVVDPAMTPIEVSAQPEGITVVRMRLERDGALDLRCLPTGPVEVVASKGRPRLVRQWRDVAEAVTAVVSA